MNPLVFKLLLVIALTGCGLGTQSQPDLPPFHSKATFRRCITRLELRGTGHALSGITGDIKEFPAAKIFSDNWIGVEWVLEPRALHAQITNRADAAITINSVIVGYDEQRTATPVMQLPPRSSQSVRLASFGESQEHFNSARTMRPPAATNELQVEIRIRAAEQECSYQFQLAPEIYNPKLAWSLPPLDDPIRDPSVPAVRIAGREPEYPETARHARIAGRVLVEVVIEADGRISGTRVLKPLPFGITEAAVVAVRTWQYKPAENHGKPVRSVQTVSLIFPPPDPAPSNSTQQLP